LNVEIDYDISLRNFTRNYLHLDLNKSCQLSNWGKRPLSDDQLEYAACDALVLLRLYDIMTCEANLLPNFDIKDILTVAQEGIFTHRKKRPSSNLLSVSSTLSRLSSSTATATATTIDKTILKSDCRLRSKSEEEDLPVYRKFYSFAERHWYYNEYSTNKKKDVNEDETVHNYIINRVPQKSKKIKFSDDGNSVNNK
jgi:hypothetical protein